MKNLNLVVLFLILVLLVLAGMWFFRSKPPAVAQPAEISAPDAPARP